MGTVSDGSRQHPWDRWADASKPSFTLGAVDLVRKCSRSLDQEVDGAPGVAAQVALA